MQIQNKKNINHIDPKHIMIGSNFNIQNFLWENLSYNNI